MITKEDSIYLKIKEDILNNEFEAGSVMVERKLAEKYGVSRSPIRYALKQLVNEGLLSNDGGNRIIVPIYSLEDVLQVFDLLEVLHSYALKVSINNYDQIADTKLEYIIGELKRANQERNLVNRMEWDIRFHKFIIDNVGNKRLENIFDMLMNQKRRFDISSFDDQEHGDITTMQHEKIFSAIIKRDLDAAIAALEEHTKYIQKYYIEKMITNRYRF